MRVRFENVGKRFGAHVALREIELDVEPGECVVLLGPSGCGKTTLLRLLAGLESADEGRLYIGDRRVNDVPPAERDVAMVFQNYALYPHFTVFDNVAFPLRARRMPAAEIAPRVKEAARRLELDTLLDRKPAQLSGGQQQRVALARAIVRNPGVYLMDEPLSNLDAQLRVQTRAELKRLQQELGTTTLYVTHDQGEAMTMGSRVVVLRQGQVEQAHAPRALPAAREPVRGHVPRQPGHEPVAGRARRRHGAGRGRRSRDAAVVTGRGRRRRGLRGRRAAGGRRLGGRSGTRTRARSGGGGGADGQRDDRGARRGRYAGGGPRPRRPPLPARVDALVLGGARPCPLL